MRMQNDHILRIGRELLSIFFMPHSLHRLGCGFFFVGEMNKNDKTHKLNTKKREKSERKLHENRKKRLAVAFFRENSARFRRIKQKISTQDGKHTVFILSKSDMTFLYIYICCVFSA